MQPPRAGLVAGRSRLPKRRVPFRAAAASAAKGLCQNHYAKAKRLKLDADNLSDADRKTLAADLRGQRGGR